MVVLCRGRRGREWGWAPCGCLRPRHCWHPSQQQGSCTTSPESWVPSSSSLLAPFAKTPPLVTAGALRNNRGVVPRVLRVGCLRPRHCWHPSPKRLPSSLLVPFATTGELYHES